ncbi:MAG: family 20 glycosylhydrolase [Alistipes sp.]|nr:family 20 glycosylhydrolase [Alistipes sp.]
MRLRFTTLTIFSVMLMTLVASAQKSIIPTPRSYEVANGVYTLSTDATVGYSDERLRPIADYLMEYVDLTIADGCGGDITLNIDSSMSEEQYCLQVTVDGVTIKGGSYAGVFNGVTTFLQLLPADVYAKQLSRPVRIECCMIDDSPRFEHRGFMLDPCRTWVSKEHVLAYIDLLAYHKINCLRLHLTDDEAWRIEIKSHPELAEIGGFRGGESPVWARYGKWNERWGGYYTQDDMRAIIDYARVRNITVVPEIDLPGHSLCMASIHPEILCDYVPNKSASFGYDTRSAFCPSNEANYELLDDIISEICALFDSEYIHIGGDEVDMSQWRLCPRCQAFMREHNMSSTDQLQVYFMDRVSDMVAKHGKKPAVWNEAIEGGKLDPDTRVYGWEGIKECRAAAAQGYPTVIIAGQYFYFDMKQTPREPGHDWAAIFDSKKVYGFTPVGVGFTPEEEANVLGLESTFFSEAYASREPESPDYMHYQTFPRMVSFAEVAWVDSDERDWDHFYRRMVDHYARLDAMGVAYRLMPPDVKYDGGVLSVAVDDCSDVYYRCEPMQVEMLYTEPIATDNPAEYSFVSRRGSAQSPEVGVAAHFKTITPSFKITSSLGDRANFSFEKAQGYGRLARTSRTGDVGDWVQFTFDTAVKCRRMKVATGNFQLPRYIFENGYVELSYDGVHFERVGELENGMYFIEYPPRAIKAVRIVCTSRGNGASWVSIQPPTIWPLI